MRYWRPLCLVIFLCAVTGSAFASKITMHDGEGSIPFDTLNFTIVLASNGTQCLDNGTPVDCIFNNQVGDTITQIDFTLQIPSLPSSDTCSITSSSPFQECNVAFATLSGPTYEEIFEFYDGSLPTGHEFGLYFDGFQGGTSFTATGVPNPDPSSAPEPASAVLMLAALAGATVLLRSRQ